MKNVYNPVIQTISLGNEQNTVDDRKVQFLGLELRSNISSWCVLDPTDMNLVYSYDNVVATSSAASTRREQVKKNVSQVKEYEHLSRRSLTDHKRV